MQRVTWLSVLIVLVLLTPEAVRSAPRPKLEFTLIADLTEFPISGPNMSLNKFGVVAFTQRTAAGEAIFKGDGGTVAKVVETGPQFASLEATDINDRGEVAFTATTVDGQHGVFKATSAGVVLIANVECCVKHVAMNNFGEVTFVAGAGQQGRKTTVYVGDGRTLKTLASEGDGFVGVDSPDINDRGVVAFVASRNGLGEIVIADGASLTTIADTTGLLCSLSVPYINDAGTVAFDVFLGPSCMAPEVTGLAVYERGHLAVWGRAGVNYRDIGGALALNDRGHVEVLGTSLDGREGLFVQTAERIELVVASGDVIDGRVLVSTPGGQSSLNNRGQFAFLGHFDDGRHRLYRANP